MIFFSFQKNKKKRERNFPYTTPREGKGLSFFQENGENFERTKRRMGAVGVLCCVAVKAFKELL